MGPDLPCQSPVIDNDQQVIVYMKWVKIKDHDPSTINYQLIHLAIYIINLILNFILIIYLCMYPSTIHYYLGIYYPLSETMTT